MKARLVDAIRVKDGGTEVRNRLAATEFIVFAREGVSVSTPPIDAMRMIISNPGPRCSAVYEASVHRCRHCGLAAQGHSILW